MTSISAARKAGNQSLGGAEKAAFVLLTLPKPKAMELIKCLSADEIKELARAAENLRAADSEEIDRIVAEFEANFASGVTLMGTGSEVRSLIAEVLGEDQLDAVLSGPRVVQEPVWPQLAEMKETALHTYLSSQHPQAAAYILSQLRSSQVASVIKLLTREQRNDLIVRMLSLGSISDLVKAQIEQAIRADLTKTTVEQPRPHGSIAGILNELESTQTDEAIAYLDSSLPQDAGAIKKLLFKFENLPSLSTKSLTVLFDRTPVERTVVALQGLDPAIQNTVLSALAPRARRLAESELNSGATAPAEEVALARKAVVEMVLAMMSRGELTLAEEAGAEPQPA